ncbi:YciI family protein [Sphingomonas turrisvirgatae]|uniref:GTP cyclohydrolase n=1 Tax=Sphingomonas turrisvirgatae TaxID=1888892 RepID=A0A1E3LVM7_9SPHN|nr:YciI family protein [Sphingomonas turrisvirgatae]ODP37793.1 GTP cyclohydrolase [Sphingomonas turrisvirgatae]
MIVVLLTYKVAPDAVAAHRAAHVEWLNHGVADGRVLLAGRKPSADGGMFIARGTLAQVEAWAAHDPFAREGLADYQFVEITPTILAPGLEALGQ